MSGSGGRRGLGGVAARGAIATFSGQWSKFLLQAIGIVLLSRLLDPSDFGVVAMLLALAGVAALLSDFGLSLASMQSQTITEGQRSKLFWVNAGVGLILSMTVCSCAQLIAAFYDEPRLVQLTYAISPIFFLNGLMAQWKAVTASRLRFVPMAIADVSAQALALAVGVVLALSGAEYWSLIWQQVVLAGATCLGMACASRWRPGFVWRSASIREFLGFGANTLGVQLINYASSNADSLVIGRYMGATALGSYDRAYQLFRIPLLQIAAPMARVAIPILSRLKDDVAFERYILQSQKLLVYSMGSYFVLSAALAPAIIDFLLGPGWSAAKPVLAILAIGGFFQAVSLVYFWVFIAKSLTALQLRIAFFTRGLMVGGIVMGVNWGLQGVAIAGTLGLALNWAALTFLGMPRAGVKPINMLKGLTLPCIVLSLSGAAAAATGKLVQPYVSTWVDLVSGVLAFGIVVGALAVARPVRRDYLAVATILLRARRA